MANYLGICLELSGFRPSQYASYNFNSMCKFGDKYLGANENGIFELDNGDLDGLADVDAFFELATSDFGSANQKRIRSAYIGYEANGDLLLTVKDDEDNERTFNLEANHLDNMQHSAKVPIGRNGKGRYYTFRFDNIAGSDFSVDSIKIIPVILNRKPSKS